jgi:hypothetical protein
LTTREGYVGKSPKRVKKKEIKKRKTKWKKYSNMVLRLNQKT